jgi:hypothetical protein
MGFFIEHWLAIAVAANTALLIFIAAEARGVPDRLAYLGRRIDKLDRALRGSRLIVVPERQAGVKLITDRSSSGRDPELSSDPYGEWRRAANQ